MTSSEPERRGSKTAPAPEPPAAHNWHLTGLCLAVVLAPFAWSTHFVSEYTLPKLACVVLGVLVAAAGAALEPAMAWRSPLDAAIAVNFLAIIVTTLTSQDRWLSLVGRYNSYSHGLATCVLYAGLGLLGARLDRRSVLRATGALLVGGAVIAAYGIAQTMGYEWFSRAPLPQGRAVSSIGSPVDLGAYLAAIFPLALAWTAGRPGLWGAAAAMIIAGGLWSTASRGPWLAALVGTAAFVFLMLGATEPGKAKDNLRKVPAWAWAALAIAVAAGGWLAYRRLAVRGVTQSTDTARYEVWRSAWRIFETRPMLGTGPDTFEQAFRRRRTEEFVRRMGGSVRFQAYAHNDLLQALATTGLLGTGAYLYLLFSIAAAGLAACRDPNGRWLPAGLFAGLLGVFVVVKFNPVALEVMALVSLVAGLLAALTRPHETPRPAPLQAGLERAGALSLLGACLAGGVILAQWSLADLHAKSAQTLFTKVGILEQADPQIPSAYGMRIAGMEEIRDAINRNPCELAYRVQQMNEMGALINANKNVQGRLNLLAEAEEAGKAAVACHPTEVNAHYVAGISAWMHVQLGMEQYLEAAERELDRAIELDPMFLPLLEQRLIIARRRGGPSVAEWAKRVAEAKARAPV